MSSVTTTRALLRRARQWHAWLHRHGWQAVLVGLLAFSIVEPLACIIHCGSWALLDAHGGSAAQPTHAHGMIHATPGGEIHTSATISPTQHQHAAADVLVDAQIAPHAAGEVCHSSDQDGVLATTNPVLSPISLHEHLAALIAPAPPAQVVLLWHASAIPPYLHAPRREPPPLRPPITVTA